MLKSFCDGTGVEIPADAPPTGPYGRQYAELVRPVAEAYLAAKDALHTEIAEKFAAKLERLRAKYRVTLASLPDDPPQ